MPNLVLFEKSSRQIYEPKTQLMTTDDVKTVTLQNKISDINILRNLLMREINNFKDNDTEERRFVAKILDFTFKDVISVEIAKSLIEKTRYYYICFHVNLHYSFESLDWMTSAGGAGGVTGVDGVTGFASGEWTRYDKAFKTWTTLKDIKQINSACFERTCTVNVSKDFNYHIRIEFHKDKHSKEYWLGDCWCWVYHDTVQQDNSDLRKSAFVNDSLLKLLEIFESREIFPNYFEIGSDISRGLSKYFNWDIVKICCQYY